MARPINVLSVDVEEWYQTVLFDPASVEDGPKTDLPREVERIASLLEGFGVKATFFVVGCLSRKYPGLVRSIAARGHEVASHGFSHRLVHTLAPEEFARELAQSREVLSAEAGAPVSGYRASTWSLPSELGRAVRAIKQAGYLYDSSLYPVRALPRLGSDSDWQRFPRRLDCGLLEFPPSTASFLGWNVPFGGGTFLRCQTLGSLRQRIESLNAVGQPAMIYCHSWEFCEAIPEGIPHWKRLVQFANVRSVARKIEALLGLFEFRPVKDALLRMLPLCATAGKSCS